MKTRKTNYVLILVLCTVISAALLCVISVRTANNILAENSAERLMLVRDNSALKFNSAIKSIEQSVDTLSSAALNHLDDKELFKSSSEYVDSYTESLTDVMLYTAENTTGAMSIYIRYNPDLAYPTSGAFFVKNQNSGVFEAEPPTDFSLYVNDKDGRTEWYDIPVTQKAPTWIEPYENKNIGYTMISYVVPIIADDEVYGVIGMDIDYNYICELAKSIKVYDTGYACLVNRKGQIIYHPEHKLYVQYTAFEELDGFSEIISSEEGFGNYIYHGQEKTAVCAELNAGMILCIIAPDSEIYADAETLKYHLVVVSAAICFILAAVSAVILVRLVKASETDDLTGLLNRQGFVRKYGRMDQTMLDSCGVLVFDIDRFSSVNDRFGHSAGDEAIKFVATAAVSAVGRNGFAARWSGDEFIVLLQSGIAEEKIEKIIRTVEENESGVFGKITVSAGYAETGGEKDLARVTEKAERALFNAKNSGGNMVSFGNDPAEMHK